MVNNYSSIPYSRHQIEDDDVEAVISALRSPFLTTGPLVPAFEAAVVEEVGTGSAVALSSGTAALHAAVSCAGIGAGDEVVVPAITFAATANAVVYCGARPVFADVEAESLLIDPNSAAALVKPATRMVIAVDYAGQPADYEALRSCARRYDSFLLADACHSLGASYRGRPVGTLADATVFSFHPVKPVTTAEGGMLVSADESLVERARAFRNHGIDIDFRQRSEAAAWEYSIARLGYNYRLSDLHAALGISQLKRLHQGRERRNRIAARYREAFQGTPVIRPLTQHTDRSSACHLFVVQIDFETIGRSRKELFLFMQERRIRINVHYLPVYLHPFYRTRFQTRPGLCPVAEKQYARIVSLPIFSAMTDAEVDRVITALTDFIDGNP